MKIFKKLISIILSILLICCVLPFSAVTVSAATYSGTCGDNLTWTLDNNGTLTISGTGDMTDWSEYKDSPWYSLCSEIKTVIISSGVTSIGNKAFGGTFSQYYTNLTSVSIPDTVEKIGSHAFLYCKNVISINIPDSIRSIGNFAFYNCTSLNAVHINNVSKWCNIDFGLNNSNPLEYAKNLYLNGEIITNLIIPDGVTRIESLAFYGCESISTMQISDSVT